MIEFAIGYLISSVFIIPFYQMWNKRTIKKRHLNIKINMTLPEFLDDMGDGQVAFYISDKGIKTKIIPVHLKEKYLDFLKEIKTELPPQSKLEDFLKNNK